MLPTILGYLFVAIFWIILAVPVIATFGWFISIICKSIVNIKQSIEEFKGTEQNES